MNSDFSKNSDEEIKEKIKEWSGSMFTHTKKGADINSVRLYTPLIQLAQNELTSRYIKKTTLIAVGISLVALGISFTALQVSKGNVEIETISQSSENTAEQKSWTLSLYRDGITIFRFDHNSLESCQSAGNSYMADQSITRFDCGLNCEESIDLSKSILCEQVCNPGGCR